MPGVFRFSSLMSSQHTAFICPVPFCFAIAILIRIIKCSSSRRFPFSTLKFTKNDTRNSVIGKRDWNYLVHCHLPHYLAASIRCGLSMCDTIPATV